MELALFFYLAGVIENASAVVVALSLFTISVFCGYSVFGAMHYDCNHSRNEEGWRPYYSARKKLFKWCIAGAVGLLISSFLPSKSTMYTMAAAYGAQSIVENPDVKRLAGKSLDVIEQAMDKYLDKKGAD